MSDQKSSVKLACLECGQGNRLPAERIGPSAKCGTCGASLFSAKARTVSPDILAKAARIDSLPLVVDFWAPWCGPCRMMAPEFDKASERLSGLARLVKLNTQDFPDAAQAHRIRGIPTLVAFGRGAERGRQSGALRCDEIVQFATSTRPA